MTYDPDRDERAPSEVNPNYPPVESRRGRTGVGILLGILAALVVATLVVYGLSNQSDLVSNPAPQTTGTGGADQNRAPGKDTAPSGTPAR